LTAAQRTELQQRTRAPGVLPRTRDRLEMVRLAAAGWSIPKTARYLQMSEVRVRHWIKQFLTGGFDALPDQPHPGQTSQLTPALLAAIRAELAKSDRTWTARQLAAWLAAHHDLHLSPDWLGE
jgi:transposase